jgi:hypothetical protein
MLAHNKNNNVNYMVMTYEALKQVALEPLHHFIHLA